MTDPADQRLVPTLELPIVRPRRRTARTLAVAAAYLAAIIGIIAAIIAISSIPEIVNRDTDEQPNIPATPCTISSDVSIGSTGLDAGCVEASLQAAGIPASVDFYIGVDDDEAIRSFQRSAGRSVDGVVGPKTAASLGIGYVHIEMP